MASAEGSCRVCRNQPTREGRNGFRLQPFSKKVYGRVFRWICGKEGQRESSQAWIITGLSSVSPKVIARTAISLFFMASGGWVGISAQEPGA